MLTLEKLKKDKTIAAANIPDSVLNAIATLSENDESIIIKEKQGEVYGVIDNALNTALGESKPQGQKTSVWFAQKISELKKTADQAGNVGEITTERDNLKTQVADLKKKIADGSTDAALKKQLSDLQADLKQKEADIASITKTKDDKISELQKGLDTELSTNLNLKLQSEADAYFSTLKFDKKLPDWAVAAKKKEVISEVLKKGKPAWDGEGENRKFVFKDENGSVLNNASNGLNPFIFGELASEFVKNAVVDGGGGGGGTGGGAAGGGGGGSFSIGGLKSKQEVTEAIKRQLASDGLSITDPSYQGKFDEMYKTEGVSELPLTV